MSEYAGTKKMPLSLTYMSEGAFKSLVKDAQDFDASADKYGVAWLMRCPVAIIAASLDYLLRVNRIRSKCKTIEPCVLWKAVTVDDFAPMYWAMDELFESACGEEHALSFDKCLHEAGLATCIRAICKPEDEEEDE